MSRAIRSRREAGVSRFDLITAIGSVVLLGVVAGVPDAGQDPQTQLATASAVVRDALDLTRSLAVAEAAPHGLAIDLEHERLAIVDAQGQLARLPDDLDALIDLGELGVDVTAAAFGQGGAVIVMDVQGLPLSTGWLELVAGEGEQRRAVALRLDAATGRLDVAD